MQDTEHDNRPNFKIIIVDQPSLVVSLLRQIRAEFREPEITVSPTQYRGKMTLPVTDMKPWYRNLHEDIVLFGELLSNVWLQFLRKIGLRPKLPKIKELDIWQDFPQQKASWLNSLLAHVIAIAILVLPFAVTQIKTESRKKFVVTYISPYVSPELPGPDKRTGGGGGGGDRSPTPASKGAIPKFAKTQLAPPMVLPNLEPKLAVQPTLLGPPELKLPQMNERGPWGEPQGAVGPPSGGPGFGGGIGTGEGTGVGPGRGGGFGPGEGGGFGGGTYSVGGGVSAPIPIYKPEPPYSEEARKAKYQGTVVILIIVDAHGSVTDARIMKPLGLGLDEKAVETVRTWKFKPGMRNGIPVPVRVMVEVTFRLF